MVIQIRFLCQILVPTTYKLPNFLDQMKKNIKLLSIYFATCLIDLANTMHNLIEVLNYFFPTLKFCLAAKTTSQRKLYK